MSSNNSTKLDSSISTLYNACSNCGECSLTCPPHFWGLFNPMGVLRRLQRDGIEETIKYEPLFNCVTCNRCMMNCPNADPVRGMDFARMIRYLRQYAVDHNLTIPQTEILNPLNILIPKFSDHILLKNKLFLSQKKSLKIEDTGEIAFFMGDIIHFSKKDALSHIDWISYPSAAIKLLNQVGINPVICDTYGSGHDEFWAGYHQTSMQIAQKNVDIFSQAGISTVICEDAESYYMWKNIYPKMVSGFSFEVKHLSEFLIDQNRFSKLKFDVPLKLSYIFHDVSRLGRDNPQLYDIPRQLLDKVPGISRKEIDSTHDEAYDYKLSFYQNDSPKLDKMWDQFISELKLAEANYFLTCSLKSIVAFEKQLKNYSNTESPGIIPQIKEYAVFLSRFLP